MVDKLDKLIIDTVTLHQGLKAPELAVHAAIHPVGRTGAGRLLERIYGLIEEGELVAVDYVLPDLDYVEKTLVLPKGSKVTFVFPKGTRVNQG